MTPEVIDANTNTNTTPTIDEVLASDARVQAFDEWASAEPLLQAHISDPNTRQLLRRVFLTGAVTQQSIDAAALEAVTTQRDFLDQVCARSQDGCTRHWRSGFEGGCPPELIWPSQSGGVGVEGSDAHPAAAELHLFEVLIHERVCWVVAESESSAAAIAMRTTVQSDVSRLADDEHLLEPVVAGKTLRDAAAEQMATGRPGYLGSRNW